MGQPWYETAALVRGGAADQAAEDVRLFAEHFGTNQRYRLAYLCSLAVLAGWRGETDRAIEHIQAAAIIADDLELPGEHWQILAALGELHQRRGEAEQARHACARVTTIAQGLAGKIEDAQLKAFLRAVQMRCAPPI